MPDPRPMPPGGVTLRPATPADLHFLLRLYQESRAAELESTGWTAEQKAAFCAGQFAAQDAHYRRHYPDCEFLVIERDGAPSGRLYRERRADEIRVVDLALLASERGRGVGGRLLQAILDEAGAAGLAVSLHVERFNPARRLYERLGFRLEEAGGIHDLLRWRNSV